MDKLYVDMPVIVAQVANFRQAPGISGTLIKQLLVGHEGKITAGPIVADDLTWWQLDNEGWAVESVDDQDVIEVAPASDFEKSVFFVFKHEGNYGNDPNDPGGETRWGISKRSYPNVNIKDLSKETARDIYYNDYWMKGGCDHLPWPTNCIHLDASVNCGLSQAAEFLQESNGIPITYMDLRIYFYQHARQYALYGGGWMNRIDDLEQYTGIDKARRNRLSGIQV